MLLKENTLLQRENTENKADVHFLKSPSLMSMNIQIFEYSNKMALEYYSYSYSCHFSSTNIFGYSFLKIRIYLNIYSERYFDICLSICDEKSKSRYSLCTKNLQCKILLIGSMSESF